MVIRETERVWERKYVYERQNCHTPECSTNIQWKALRVSFVEIFGQKYVFSAENFVLVRTNFSSAAKVSFRETHMGLLRSFVLHSGVWRSSFHDTFSTFRGSAQLIFHDMFIYLSKFVCLAPIFKLSLTNATTEEAGKISASRKKKSCIEKRRTAQFST